MKLPRARTVLIAAAIAPLAALASGGAPTLHEDLDTPPDEARRSAERLQGSIFGAEPQPGQNPTAFASGSRIVPRPPRAPEPGRSEPSYGGGGADRATSYRADRQTHADGVLGYDAVFNPAVTPHKRMSALDAVGSDYTLAVGSPELRQVPVGGDPDPDRDLFWATLQVDLGPGLGPGRTAPIPSVAPDMRILSYEIEPEVAVDFFVDGADNYYVRAAGGGGSARLVMLVDADADYFGAPIPDHLRVRDADAARVPEVPPGPRGQAGEALAQLGLDRDQALASALDVLVDYFRSFEAGELPTGTGDIFWDLFTSKLGVCRHRAFAFAIAANTLGIPARYVQNEAHAFAEVHIPDLGWLRVDLGGAALDLEVGGAPEAAAHQPRHRDPFATSSTGEARSSGSAGTGGTSGRPRAGGAGARDEPPLSSPEGATGERASEALPEAGGGGIAGERGLTGAAETEPGSEPGGAPASGPRNEPPGTPEGDRDTLEPGPVRVTDADREGFRGETVRVAGRVAGAADDAAGQSVELYLVPARGGAPVAIGAAVTGAGGQFESRVTLPADLELGDYRIVASTAGELPGRRR